MSAKTEFTLWYGAVLLGRIREAFMSDATWFGVFESRLDPTASQLTRRLADFIAFSEDFYEHDPNTEDAPDPVVEFKRFSDVVETGEWRVEAATGDFHSIGGCPAIFKGGEISWCER